MATPEAHLRARRVFCLLASLGSILLPAHGRQLVESTSEIPAVWVFGDSTVDSGNNNDLNFTVFKSNFYPYGIDFPNHVATGRFCDGYLSPDYIAKRLGLPLTPPYFNKHTKTSQYQTGVNFASAGSGTIASTATKLGTIHLHRQADAFLGPYRKQLIEEVGENRASYILREGFYICSTGTNDYLINYKLDPVLQAEVSKDEFQDEMVGSVVNFLEKIHGGGARRMAVLSMIPLGCLPSQKTLYAADIVNDSQCVEELNDFAKGFNRKLKTAMTNFQNKHTDSIVKLAEIYDKFDDIFKNPNEYGMRFTRDACCGLGLYEAAIGCNAATKLCTDATQYVFWDSFHPSQQTYKALADYLWEQYSQPLLASLPSQGALKGCGLYTPRTFNCMENLSLIGQNKRKICLPFGLLVCM